jgi:hypothetical protein
LALGIHAVVPILVTTILFSILTLVRVITYVHPSGPPVTDPGFAPAGNTPLVFFGMELIILFQAVVQLLPYLVAGAIIALLSPLAGFSSILHALACGILGGLLAFGWWVAVRASFDVIAQQITLFSAIGFLVSGATASYALRR